MDGDTLQHQDVVCLPTLEDGEVGGIDGMIRGFTMFTDIGDDGRRVARSWGYAHMFRNPRSEMASCLANVCRIAHSTRKFINDVASEIIRDHVLKWEHFSNSVIILKYYFQINIWVKLAYKLL